MAMSRRAVGPLLRVALRPRQRPAPAAMAATRGIVYQQKGTWELVEHVMGDPEKSYAYVKMRMEEEEEKLGRRDAPCPIQAEESNDVLNRISTADRRVPDKPKNHVRLSVKKVKRAEDRERLASKHKVKNVLHWIRWTRRHKVRISDD